MSSESCIKTLMMDTVLIFETMIYFYCQMQLSGQEVTMTGALIWQLYLYLYCVSVLYDDKFYIQ